MDRMKDTLPKHSQHPDPDMALWVGVILGFLFIASSFGILAWAVLNALAWQN